MKYLIITLATVSSLFSNECATVFPDVFSSQTAITFESRLDIDSKSNKLQTPTINQSILKSKCDGSRCKATDTIPNSLKLFDFKITTIDETIEVSKDTLYDKENIPNIIITKDNTVVTFKAPPPKKGFTPTQKIGSIKVEAKNVTLVFEAGDYYIKSFEAKSSVTKQRGMSSSMNDTLTITPNGNTRMFIDESFYISKQGLNPMSKSLLINAKKTKQLRFTSKKQDEDIDIKKLIIYTKDNIEIDTSYEINALIYGYSDIKLSSDLQSEFRGAIHAKGELTLGKQKSFKSGKFIYDEESVKELWKLSACRALPNEVDEELGKATLLGIDENRNFVRDDVERWIIESYSNIKERAMFIQSASAYQRVIVDPSKAYETTIFEDDSYACTEYIIENDIDLAKKYRYKHADKELEKVQFNTIKRHIAYQRYNGELSGGVFKAPKHLKEKCTFDTDSIGVQ
jgi:hypothetical protein